MASALIKTMCHIDAIVIAHTATQIVRQIQWVLARIYLVKTTLFALETLQVIFVKVFFMIFLFENIFSKDYKCSCMDWTIGENCEQVINPCDYVSCGLAGSCIKRRTLAYECKCQDGYVGLKCEQPIQETCLSNRCVRGDCLINETGHLSCKCPTTGYGGDSCEIERCSPQCSNGVCKENSYGQFYCECGSGYKGSSCSEKSNLF